MTDISVTKVVRQSEDRSWLGSAHGTDATQTVTLNFALFTSGTHYPNGYIPSGVALGKVAATGAYGPYDNDANDGRTVMVGHLFNSITVPSDTSTPVGAPILLHGQVIESKLPTGHGVDANGKIDVGSRIIYR